MKKKILIILTIAIAIVGIGYGIGNYFVSYALSPTSDSDQREISSEDAIELESHTKQQIEKNKEIEKQKGIQFSKKTQETSLQSQDHFTLKAKYKAQDTHEWVILIHGYKSNNENMMSYGETYYQKGYNVLLPNNRAHGNSEGHYIGMGWLDKEDIALWVDWIVNRDKEAKIIIHGVSMGGATTMMISGDNLDHVVGYVEDCGYTSVWDIFASELDKRFSLPTFPVLDVSNLVANIKAGYDFKKASSLEQVKLNQKPMLFIHGGQDDFVPTDMVYEVYGACQSIKDLYIADQAGHAESKDYDPQAYWNKVFSFIDKNI